MEIKTIIGKAAISKESVPLGKIIRIEQLIGKTVKKMEDHAIVEVRRFLKKNLHVAINSNKILEIKEDTVIFDISHKEFDDECKRIEQVTKVKESYQEYPSGSWKDFQGGVRIPRRKGD